jgi:hypothetical protein
VTGSSEAAAEETILFIFQNGEDTVHLRQA